MPTIPGETLTGITAGATGSDYSLDRQRYVRRVMYDAPNGEVLQSSDEEPTGAYAASIAQHMAHRDPADGYFPTGAGVRFGTDVPSGGPYGVPYNSDPLPLGTAIGSPPDTSFNPSEATSGIVDAVWACYWWPTRTGDGGIGTLWDPAGDDGYTYEWDIEFGAWIPSSAVSLTALRDAVSAANARPAGYLPTGPVTIDQVEARISRATWTASPQDEAPVAWQWSFTTLTPPDLASEGSLGLYVRAAVDADGHVGTLTDRADRGSLLGTYGPGDTGWHTVSESLVEAIVAAEDADRAAGAATSRRLFGLFEPDEFDAPPGGAFRRRVRSPQLELRVTVTIPDYVKGVEPVRLWPRDDGRGMASAARIYPVPRGTSRIHGGIR